MILIFRVFICFESLTRALDKLLLSAEYPSHHAGRDSLLHSPRFPQRGVDSKPSPRRLDKQGKEGAAAGGGAFEPGFEWVPEILGLVDRCIETAMENERHRTLSEVRVHDRLQVTSFFALFFRRWLLNCIKFVRRIYGITFWASALAPLSHPLPHVVYNLI